jgi:two-component system KDP operon response regulator KdpE
MAVKSDKTETKPFSVLVVDDEEYILAFIGIRLKVSGYKVLTAADGIQALEIIRNIVPDLVVIDLIMPRMDGPTLLKEIREFSSVPVIILSSIESHDVIVQELLNGADDYIHKPFNPDDLVARIEAVRRRLQNPGHAA